MKATRFNQKEFSAKVNGTDYQFLAYTTNTRNGFCHTIKNLTKDVTDTKVGWGNRTWERFDYECALKGAIEKCPKEDRQKLYDVLIEKKHEEVTKECVAFEKSFKKNFNSLSNQNKERLAKLPPINTMGQAKTVNAMMLIANLLDK